MTTPINVKKNSVQPTLSEEEIQIIVQYWIRIIKIKLGWIRDFDKFVVNYVTFFVFFKSKYLFVVIATTVFMIDSFCVSSKLLKIFNGHNTRVYSIDNFTFDDCQFICSGSGDRTVRVWDVKTTKQIQSFNEHLSYVFCVKFSQYHYRSNKRTVICSSSSDKTIRFWDIKYNRSFQIFTGHTSSVYGMKFSPFNGGRYLCSGSFDKTIRLWDVETSKSLHIFYGHEGCVWCVDFSPLQGNNKNDKSNSIGVIGGNGYTICSGAWDNTIRMWDIETTKQLIVFKGHEQFLNSVKYGSNKSGISGSTNTILSGSDDNSVRLWDIRSGQQIQVFRHINAVYAAEYSPFINSNEFGDDSNVICSGSYDNTIRFWDIRSNKELHTINGDDQEDDGICCLEFLQLKKEKKKSNNNSGYGITLCYGSRKGRICIWG
ncbi:G-protein beta WD-40 repeats containing protein [Reticulomyxa filosa]|uniref:G-protein beta WD-40 repeats containing protein n=1 Tax=Reticulomyxa filosa TaxID=46433 RepID=X6M922_RETFI|nr:G-protein beta WD-40 repeats containing protein [Reticulomyxa filosa]|eukprot:ETO10498.1 G-protein beta WD-40 repeats containing protein [Reticulomyxa filosa]